MSRRKGGLAGGVERGRGGGLRGGIEGGGRVREGRQRCSLSHTTQHSWEDGNKWSEQGRIENDGSQS